MHACEYMKYASVHTYACRYVTVVHSVYVHVYGFVMFCMHIHASMFSKHARTHVYMWHKCMHVYALVMLCLCLRVYKLCKDDLHV
jgi:hypothetical protein